ncbi:BCCT family transporter [Camelimonas sp. ID_303_24]
MSGFVVKPPVFFGAVAIIVAFLLVGALLPGQAETAFGAMQAWVLSRFGWFYLLSVAVFVGAAIILATGRTGDLKLGPDDAEPDFPYLSWLAMLFAAGMGIGLMYFAVGEPLMHAAAPPDVPPGGPAASRAAMSITFFHWGIHAWAIYAIVGLSLAYFGFRYNLPLTIRSGLYPLLKNRINGGLGHAVDIFAICGTVFGIAASLGFGVMQMSAGLHYLTGIEASTRLNLILVVAVTAIAMLSAVTGVEKGVRRLSELNLLVAVLLMLFVLAVGPTELLMRDFVQNIGAWLDTLLLRTFNIYAYDPKPWIDKWTLFYWAWWISWSPFVGMFIARISRGRTVREFVVGVLLAPTAFTFFWMTVFGNTAMFIDQTAAQGALATAVQADLSVALFKFFTYLPWPAITSTVAVILVAIFFVTSADSGSLVVDTLASGGETRTPWLQRVFWCALEGGAAAVLLLTGGLAALQAATVATALPFCVIMLVLVWGLFRGMRADLVQANARGALAATPAVTVPWQRRLSLIVNTPDADDVAAFIDGQATPALESVAEELTRRGRPARVERGEGAIVSLVAAAEGVRDFVYGVQVAEHRLPGLTMLDTRDADVRHEARTYFSDGSRGYDIMGLTREQIIFDVLSRYEAWQAVTQMPEAALVVRAPEHAPPEPASAGEHPAAMKE